MMVGAGVSINQRNITAKPQGPNPLYLPPCGVTLVHFKKQVRATRNTQGHAPNQNLQPAGDQVSALTLADVTTVYFSVTNRIKRNGTNRPPPWLFYEEYIGCQFTNTAGWQISMFSSDVRVGEGRGGVVFAPASSYTADLNFIKIINL